MAQLADYKALIDAAGYDTASLGTAADLIINEARRRVVRERRWSWLEARDTALLTTIVGNPEVALTAVADLDYIDAIRLKLGTDEFITRHLPSQELRELEGGLTWRNDADFYWTKLAGKIRIYPTPDRVYTLQLDYIKRLTDLTGVTQDTIPDSLRDLVVWAALPYFAHRQRDANAQNAAENTYSYRLRSAVAQDNLQQRQHSEQVRTGYWG